MFDKVLSSSSLTVWQHTLTDKQREATQGLLDGLQVEEIARRTNSKRNAVYKLIHDARIRLRDGFAEQEQTMALSKKQISSLLQMVSVATEDAMDCDGCFDHMAEFADAELAGQEIPNAPTAVENHLRQCTCCKDEYQTLLEGLKGLGGDAD